MPADAQNRINLLAAKAAFRSAGAYPGDLPDGIRDRYYTETRFLAPFAYYRDARSKDPAFRDHGGRLSTDRNDPAIVRDLVAIAKHRQWSTVAVRGHTDFRRELWMTARVAGLDVRGYRPTERDEQDLARRLQRAGRDRSPVAGPNSPDLAAPGPQERLGIVEAVVRNRIVEPSEQARILTIARNRLASWLELGARFAPIQPHRARDRERGG